MSPRQPADSSAERARAREAIFDLARRIRETGSPDIAAAALSSAEAEAVGRALARYGADLRHNDAECAEALSSARWACISTPEDAARWAADRAHLAAVSSPVGAAVRQLAAVPVVTSGRDPALATENYRKRARVALEAELFKAAATIAAAVDETIAPLDEGGTVELKDGEPFPADAAISAALEATGGPAGRDRAAEVCANSVARVRTYLENPSPETARALTAAWHPTSGGSVSPFMLVVAWAFWKDVVRPPIAEDIHFRPPAIAMQDMRRFIGMHSANRELRDDGSLVVTEGPDRGTQIARVPAELIEAVRGNIDLLSSVAAWKLFRWEVLKGHEQHYAGFGDRAHIIHVPGGWSELCNMLGMNPDKDENVRAVRRVVEAQACFVFRFGDGSEGNMLVFNYSPAKGRHQRAHLRLELADVLMPDFAGHIRSERGRYGYGSRMARRLVPMLQKWPRTIGRPSDYAGQMAMALAVVTTMRNQSERMAMPNGGALIEPDDFADLAVASRLPHNSRTLLGVIKAWKEDGEDAFLREVGKDLYTLGRPWSVERDFIVSAGAKEAGGRKRGQEYAAKKTKWLLGK